MTFMEKDVCNIEELTYEQYCSILNSPQTGEEYLSELRMQDYLDSLVDAVYPESDDTLPF